MARKKGSGRKKQGIVSWLTSIIALLIGLGPVWRILNGLFVGGGLAAATDSLNRNYNPLRGDRAALLELAEGFGAVPLLAWWKPRAKTHELIPTDDWP